MQWLRNQARGAIPQKREIGGAEIAETVLSGKRDGDRMAVSVKMSASTRAALHDHTCRVLGVVPASMPMCGEYDGMAVIEDDALEFAQVQFTYEGD